MLIANTETIPGMAITEFKGLVQGNTIRAKHVGRDIMAGLKNIVGGELTSKEANVNPRKSARRYIEDASLRSRLERFHDKDVSLYRPHQNGLSSY